MEKRITMHIVPHTHWDREWYFSVEEYRYRLVKMMDILLDGLDQGKMDYFVADGQIIMLYDYLAIRPENEQRIKELVKSGRLIIGPWYVQPNTFMSDAESLVRNLLRGRREMERFGGGMPHINYLPDQFGYNAQLPQIMCEFGMTHLVGARGLPKQCDTYFTWEGSDGSRVRVCALPNSYGNARGLGLSEESVKVRVLGTDVIYPGLREKIDGVLGEFKRTIAPQLLAMNGVDHETPNMQIKAVAAKIEELYPNVRALESNFDQYIASTESTLEREPQVYTGELRDPRENMIFPASQSMRMDIKTRNRQMEDLLERHVEPLLCLMDSLDEKNLPYALYQRAWELLLENQTHDSLCCSNCEASYREILVRYENIETLCREICNELSQRLISRIEGCPQEAVLLFNPAKSPSSGIAAFQVAVPRHRDFAEPHFFWQGEEVPAQVRQVTEDMLLRFIPFTGGVAELPVDLFDVTVNAGPVDSFGYKLLEIRGGAPQLDSRMGIVRGGRTLENEYLTATVNSDGTLDVTDKRSGRVYPRIHRFVDMGEAGNGFQHIAPVGDSTQVSAGKEMSLSVPENTPYRGCIRIRQSMSVPASLTEDRRSRSDAMTDMVITTDVVLDAGKPYLEFETTISNTAKDHRLQIAFPTDVESGSGYAGQPFDMVSRPVWPDYVGRLEYGDYEPYMNIHPMQDYCGIEDQSAGVMIASDSALEYEILPDHSTVCLTLLRATDRLLVGVLEKGRKFHMPAAQLLTDLKARYAFIPYAAGQIGGALACMDQFRHPVFAAQKDYLEAASMPDYAAPPVNLPAACTMFRIEGNALLSAVKPAENGEGMILRVFNPLDTQEEAVIEVDERFTVLQGECVRLDESACGALPCEGNRLTISLAPKKIASVRLLIKGR